MYLHLCVRWHSIHCVLRLMGTLQGCETWAREMNRCQEKRRAFGSGIYLLIHCNRTERVASDSGVLFRGVVCSGLWYFASLICGCVSLLSSRQVKAELSGVWWVADSARGKNGMNP